ncbi:MAG: glycoside hydrolase family 127 protein [Candidatus Hodarchaeota archaeon]
MTLRKFSPISLGRIDITGGYWKERQLINRTSLLPFSYEQIKKSGRIDALKRDYKGVRHIFWDSDVAKWLETACYSLKKHHDPELEKLVEEIIDLLIKIQEPDGYLNSFFTNEEPESRWKNTRDRHELYCAGHLMEAAVAHHDATGKKHFLDAMSRYADYIDTVFGKEEGKLAGYPGHEELELALIKLYRATGNEKYKNLSRYFVEERGEIPYYYVKEAEERGEPMDMTNFLNVVARMKYWQTHAPIREQEEAVGHAVRANYFYAGVADVADEFNDESLIDALNRLWEDITLRKMYITGGVGARYDGEAYGDPYELPNETAYAETCASIALVFFAHRMLQIDCQGRYADIMEKAMYNGAISGVSLDGKSFLYVNPLSFTYSVKELNELSARRTRRNTNERQPWFGCCCCPNNISRLIASIGTYAYSESAGSIAVHLYIQSEANLQVAGINVNLQQETNYPWDGSVKIGLKPEKTAKFDLKLRIPSWCKEHAIKVNGEEASPSLEKGYVTLNREWKEGDVIELQLAMDVERMYSHPFVTANTGRVALQRGPIIYCLEGVDNGENIDSIILPRTSKLTSKLEPDFFGGVVVIEGTGKRLQDQGWGNQLYSNSSSTTKECKIKAIPYYTWANREPSEMIVWIRESID